MADTNRYNLDNIGYRPPLHQRMEIADHFEAPIWVFDPNIYIIAWANKAALKLWDAETYHSLAERDFSPTSKATEQRLEQYRTDLENGLSVVDLWTFYPKGKPVSIRYKVYSITLDDGREGFVCQGLEFVDDQPDTLHSVQAVIHTSVMVSIYDINGGFIFANPAARMVSPHSKASLQDRFVEPAALEKLLKSLAENNNVTISAQINTISGIEWHDIEASYSLDATSGERSILLSETNATEKHHFKETQEYSDAIFKSMVSASIDAVLVCDSNKILLANDAAKNMLRVVSDREIKNRPLLDFVNDQFYSPVQALVDKQDGDKKAAIEEVQLLRTDGDVFAAQIVCVGARLKGKSVAHIILRDIDASLRAIRTLEESESKLRKTIDSIGDGIISINDKGAISSINTTAEALTGHSKDRALGKQLFDVFILSDDEQLQRISEEINLVVNEGESFSSKQSLSVTSGDGEEHYLVYTLLPTRDIHNLVTGVELVFRDSTELQLTNERLALMQTIIDNGADSAFIITPDAGIVYCNKTACDHYGYSQTQFRTMKLFDISPGITSEAWSQHWGKILNDKSFTLESVHLNSGGDLFDVEISVNYFQQRNQEYCLLFVRDISERKRDQAQVVHLAHHDALTGLPNRLLLLDRFSQLIKNAERYQYKVAALFLDLDNFKQVNDAMGHAAGDVILRTTAERLRGCLRQDDTIARLGGDEFVILVSNVHSPKDVELVAQQVIDKFEEPFFVEGKSVHMTTSIGIATYPEDGDKSSDLLRQADMAMYQSKAEGRNRFVRYRPEMNQAAIKRLEMHEKLRDALGNNELHVHYQPIIDLKTEAILGAEALLRWHNKDLGFVSPLEFISLAEETALILPIGQFVLRQSLTQLRDWQKKQNTISGADPLNGKRFLMSINVSARQLAESSFCDDLQLLLDEIGVFSEDIIFEITESVLISSYSQAEDTIAKLAKMNIKLAMDDFGTGYSSLTYLRRFPFSILKIDKDFVDGVMDNKSDNELVKASIAMAHSLDLIVIAEGVESSEQGLTLENMNANWAQGYYYAKPMAAADVENLLIEKDPQTPVLSH